MIDVSLLSASKRLIPFMQIVSKQLSLFFLVSNYLKFENNHVFFSFISVFWALIMYIGR